MKKLLIIIFSAVSFVTYAQTETPAEPADSSPQVEEQGSARLGYRGSVSFGAMIHNGVLNPVLFTVHGGKVSPYLFLGAGIGLYFIHNSGVNIIAGDLFGEMRVNFLDAKCTPAAGLRIGTIGPFAGVPLYLHPFVAYDFGITAHYSWSVELGLLWATNAFVTGQSIAGTYPLLSISFNF